ncbi:MAG: hypothetical protein PHU85_14640, partial [Phycisphaerae bacterium]|nr:hypothetical protein [Phycisphaerae bacterium]
MKKIAALAGCVTFALAAAALPAADIPLKNLPGAEFSPGQLKLPLTVAERSGVERKGVVVSSGVPFPAGFVADLGKLAVVDKDGKPVVSQANLMVKWHKPAYDDSAQWALVSFAANVPANGTAVYYLTDDGKAAAPASPLKVSKTDKAVQVETGAGSFTIPLAGEALLTSAKVGGKEVLGKDGLRAVITAGDWPDRTLKAGDKHVATHEAADVTVEESGPARVVVAIRGQYKPGDKDGKFYGSITRLYFTAGSASIRVIHSATNGKLDPKLEAGWRNIYTWPIADASLVADLALGDKVTVSTPVDDKAVTSDKELLVYQANDKECKVTEGGKELSGGGSDPGVLSVAADKLGLSAALRNFRVEHPHAMAGSAESLRVGLFP